MCMQAEGQDGRFILCASGNWWLMAQESSQRERRRCLIIEQQRRQIQLSLSVVNHGPKRIYCTSHIGRGTITPSCSPMPMSVHINDSAIPASSLYDIYLLGFVSIGPNRKLNQYARYSPRSFNESISFGPLQQFGQNQLNRPISRLTLRQSYQLKFCVPSWSLIYMWEIQLLTSFINGIFNY